MNYISLNGKITVDTEASLQVSNRSYRYGDGLFETMKIVNSTIRLEAFHIDRLFTSLQLLKYEIPSLFTAAKIRTDIIDLCKKNNCEKLARVRFSVFRGNGGLYDEDKKLNYVIECWSLDNSVNKLNENGLVIGVYEVVRKSCDIYSTLKSANFLPYTLAALFVKENQWNDCVLLNTSGKIADSTIANVFILKKNELITPPLTEGCINGVMRRQILSMTSELVMLGVNVKESPLSITDMESADEIFLTNAIKEIRWVKQFGGNNYLNSLTSKIYDCLMKTIVP